MNKEERINWIKKGDLNKLLFSMGLPTIVGMLITGLYNVVDAYFVSGLGTSQLAAVSVTFPLIQIIIGIGLTFGSGAASYISRLLGAGNKSQADKTASISVFYGIFIGMLFVISSILLIKPLLYFLGATDSSFVFAKDYTLIILLGAIFTIFYITMNNLATSQGQVKITMLAMCLGALINIVLDPILIYTLNFKIQGAAMATVISQFVTSIFYIFFILKGNNYLNISLKYLKFDRKIIMEILKLGIPIFLFQFLISLSISLTNIEAKVYGDYVVAAMGIVTRIMALGNYVVFGFVKGLQPIIGLNYGAKQNKRVKEAIHISIKWMTIFCFIFAIVIMLFSKPIILSFSKDVFSVMKVGSFALFIQGFVFLVFCLQIIYASAFIAMGQAREGSILNIARQGIFFIPIIFLFPFFFGLNGVIFAQPVSDILSTILTVILVLKNNKELPLW